MNATMFVIRLGCALLLGAGIGVERQWRHRIAGLRTNTLVASGAALFVMLSVLVPGEASPTRVAAQVVSGIGFLGAGVIMREGFNVRGLNTAATLWCAAAVGALSGLGLLWEAAIGTAGVLGANVLLRPLAQRLSHGPMDMTEEEMHYQFRVVARTGDEARVRALVLEAVGSSPLTLYGLRSDEIDATGRVEVAADLKGVGPHDQSLERIASRLSVEAGVSAVSWQTGAPGRA